jgi:NAD(P)-dependent dehydrogenase (short-subunit alcohol dehydrogenase family)
LKDTCVLITGATKGIGWALTRRLADAGAHVVGIARNTSEIDFPGYLYECDLSDAGQTEEVLRTIRDKYPVDAVVNNVGAAISQPLGSVELSALFETFDLNVRTAVQVTQAFVDSMKARRTGRIINLCSLSVRGARDATSYAAAKSAVIGCTRTWALELAEYGITVNAVAPGAIDTELFINAIPSGDGLGQPPASTPMGRLGSANEVASLIAFLLSAEAGFITGQVIGIDGGGSLGSTPT